MRFRAILVLFALILSVCIGVAQTKPALRLKPGDAVKVVVLGFLEYSGEYFVLSDGSITGVGFGRIRAEGRTVEQLQQEVTVKLRPYIKQPQVAVVLSQEKREAVYLVRLDPTGAQLAPVSPGMSGGFPFVPNMELRQLLALAQVPSRPEVYETRVYRKGQFFKRIDLQRLLEGDPKQWNGPLIADDLVTILPITLKNVWVVGAVRRPGEYGLRPEEGVAEAIAKALGLEQADASGRTFEILVRRGPDMTRFGERELPGATAYPLQPGDTIIVQRRELMRVSVAGEVTTPGEYLVEPGTTLAEIIGTKGGGVTVNGTIKGAYVLRRGEVLVVDAEPPTPEKPSLPLETNDVVFVQRNKREIYVLGTINEPGLKPMIDNREYRLNDALALGKGLTRDGSLRRVYVMTRKNGKLVSTQYNLDEYLKDGKAEANPILQPGDVVLFGEPKGVTLQTITQVLTNIVLFDNLIRR